MARRQRQRQPRDHSAKANQLHAHEVVSSAGDEFFLFLFFFSPYGERGGGDGIGCEPWNGDHQDASARLLISRLSIPQILGFGLDAGFSGGSSSVGAAVAAVELVVAGLGEELRCLQVASTLLLLLLFCVGGDADMSADQVEIP